MPDDNAPITVSDLDTKMLAFLSKWLGKNAIVSGGLAKRLRRKMLSKTKVRDFQDNVKRQYVEYVNAKQKTDGLFRELMTEYSGYWDQMEDLKIRMQQTDAELQDIARKVHNAPGDSPAFEAGTAQLRAIQYRIATIGLRAGITAEAIDRRRENLSEEEQRRASAALLLDRIKEAGQQLAEMKAFTDESVLTPALVNRSIAGDDEAEDTRAGAVGALDGVHAALAEALEALRAEAIAEDTTSDRLTELGAELTSAVRTASSDRAAPIRDLLSVVEEMREAVLDRLTELAGSDPVAGREVARQVKMDETVDRLQTGIDALSAKITSLTGKLEAAEGFKEKQRLAEELRGIETQKAALQERQDQLVAYKEKTADRVGRIEDIAAEAAAVNLLMAAIRDGTPTPEEAFQAYLESKPPDARTVKEAASSNSDSSTFREQVLARLDMDLATYTKSSETVVPEARMFLSEPEITRITQEQLGTLTMMINNAKSLASAGKYNEAEMIRTDALALHTDFVASRHFALPKPQAEAPDPFEAFERTLTSVAVLLDTLWGKGGDADGALRARLSDIKDMRDAQKLRADPDLSVATQALSALEGDIVNATVPDRDPVVLEKDNAAKEAAVAKVSEIKREMLDIFQTREITDLSLLANLPEDHVISITDSNGEKKFYEIKMKESSDSNLMIDRRGEDYKNVPREDMTRLRQQMQMLELLSDTDAPGCAKMLEDATAAVQELLEQVQDGDAYKAAYDEIKRVAEYLADVKIRVLFEDWRPDGYGADKAAFDRLKDGWEGSKKPADVVREARALYDRFDQIHKPAAESLREDHATAKKKLDEIEKDLSADKKGTEANVGAKIAQLTKMKPEDLFAGTAINLETKTDEEKAQLLAAPDIIRGALSYMREADKTFAGAQGKIRATLLDLREALETRSRPSVDDVQRRADALSDELRRSLVELDALLANKASNPEAFLLGMAAFLGEAQKGTMEARNDFEFAEEQKRLCKEERKKVQDWLDQNSLETHANYTEYTSIAAALGGTYDSIGRNLEASKDYKRAGQDYMDATKNWRDLHDDVTNAQVIAEAEWFFDFDAWQTKMRASVAKVAVAAGKVQEMLNGKFSDDERKDDDEAKAAVAAVNTVLNMCQGDKNSVLVFDPAVTQRLANLRNSDHADGQLPLKEKKAIMAQLREDTLKQVRRIRTRLESDPALEIYRNNPLDRGQTWVQLTATLLNMETEILKNLAP
ncbi:hypothetical protein [Phaeobacter sp. B1627]|uniref:hypothetical protein n=1 Tax=Phaeobacter sp. B1627 TaxID=2583809 RepID=UPI00111863C0|nr:hypothetical protein [Phaeobacter sp. B1627]TNJ48377.1 hypothetical protein FGE21_00035 [Phaeobacter sp. B1627]